MRVDPEVPGSLLVVMAHPDDAEFSCGGTVARWVAEGCRVHYCICTNGDKGSADEAARPDELARLREAEQRAAAGVLGVAEVVFLGYPDGVLQATLELRRDIAAVIRRRRPDAVICPDPVRFYGPTFINHPDHRAAGIAAVEAVFPAARDRLSFPELARDGLLPHRVADCYLANPERPTVAVDIAASLERKLLALLEHRSQVSEERVRSLVPKRAAELGAEAGLEAAELFHHIALP